MKLSAIFVGLAITIGVSAAFDRSQLKCGEEGFPTEYTLFKNNLQNFTPEEQAKAQKHWDAAYGCEAKNAELDAADTLIG
ncbi:hypothetical protein E3Q08_02594 [Wallemia mellicola]|uniref:Uncharacterized protein n=1 Tax=Wallemia mellicola TaxID=1708541 RepID=A0AB74KFR5_9BASI|nr:hypothetical protein E3Q24_02156 [Wallemia mellicola]TIB84317.1 hypothetical protein E3Q21_02432 [Wallemia mellicola]TIB87482.1 hypothetical protein E3Q20_02440 [Wallemia mellicola]TIC22744.1 hypothetical protein E3Q12_02437 [Wallemia mellicola]TIC39984.1 hypothetical protein E3Q07_02456 [Wallemia mellicola]